MDLINQAIKKLENYECEGQLDFLSLVNEVKKGEDKEKAGEVDREEKKRKVRQISQ